MAIDFFITIFFFILILGFLVFIHELGHFLAAKAVKVPVHEFSIGFGPTLFSHKYAETTYFIKLLPLGGYVQLEGEESTASVNGFRNKPLLPKILVLSAGVIMNFFAAIILLAIFLPSINYIFQFPYFADYNFSNTQNQILAYPVIVYPKNDSNEAILDRGEIILGANNKYFQSAQEFEKFFIENQSKEVELILYVNSNELVETQQVKLFTGEDSSDILNSDLDFGGGQQRPFYLIKFNENVTSSATLAYDLSIYQLKGLGNLIINAFSTGNFEELGESVGSPVQVAGVVGEVVEEQSFDFLIPLTAFISLSLAIFNILPFPALDGGQIVIAIIEAIRGKNLPDEFVGKINFVGFVLLMSLGILVIVKDFVQLEVFQNIFKGISTILGR